MPSGLSRHEIFAQPSGSFARAGVRHVGVLLHGLSVGARRHPLSTMITLHRARIVQPVGLPPVENGAVAVSGAGIMNVGGFEILRAEFPGVEVVDHGEVVLLPGLINAHCHLDFTCMRGSILPNRSFSGWVRRINELKRTCSDDDYLHPLPRASRSCANGARRRC